MKLAALLITAAVTIPSAIANFHIIQASGGIGTILEACPSNYYNCKCMQDGDRAAEVVVNGEGVGILPDNFFSVKAGLCGMGQLNFYKQNNGAWDFYVDGGDGSLQGTCYSNTAITSCTSRSDVYFYDQLRSILITRGSAAGCAHTLACWQR